MSGRGGRTGRGQPQMNPGNGPARCRDSELTTTYRPYEFPDDFPERLKRFQVESGRSWSEIARRIGTYRHTAWRWKEGRGRPNPES